MKKLCTGLSLTMAVILAQAVTAVPVAAPMDTEIAGRAGPVAASGVYRVLCPKTKTGGTGFLHRSGVVITAFHVISNCAPEDLVILSATGQSFTLTNIIPDQALDLALLMPSSRPPGPCFAISDRTNLPIGMAVATWGFPEGYAGPLPLVTIGYIAGADALPIGVGVMVPRIVVNAAFNRGNSGGPLIDIETGSVIGVVCSKLAPFPNDLAMLLEGLKGNGQGLVFAGSRDGQPFRLSESQILEEVIQYLRSQTQLVLGHACFPEQLRDLLRRSGIEP